LGKVYFVGAGPGDPDLITVKGRRVIESADVIIYAGSLVNPEVIACRKEGASVFDSSRMELSEIISVMAEACREGKVVARVHTGDPSLYGAIAEQMEELDRLGIDYEVIPGVSSFLASAAVLRREFTLPGVSQTVICTRIEGETPVPPSESLESLASHRASMAVFLSASRVEEVVEALRPHYGEDCPAAVVYRATWPDQRVIRGRLGEIADLVRGAGIGRTAMILVGRFLEARPLRSKVYGPKERGG